jgi:hypothetical protein
VGSNSGKHFRRNSNEAYIVLPATFTPLPGARSRRLGELGKFRLHRFWHYTRHAVFCAQVSTGHVACAVRSGKTAIIVNQFNGTTWEKWAKIGGTGVGSPSCAPLGTGQVVCVILGIDNKLTMWSGHNLEATPLLQQQPSLAGRLFALGGHLRFRPPQTRAHRRHTARLPASLRV